MTKIVILDAYSCNPGDLNWSEIEKLGELTVYDHTTKEDVTKRIKDVPHVFAKHITITKEVIKESPSLKFIGVLGTGYDNVDLDACRLSGITVCNIPNYSTRSVVQLTMALLLEITHGVGRLDVSVHKGEWDSRLPSLVELDGKTMGIVGFGQIGQLSAASAKQFGMNILYHCPHRKPKLEDEHCRYATRDELFAASDVISLHCPLHADTQGMINKETIGKMKDGVVILNTGRGGLVVEADLAAALNTGKVYAAGVDVTSSEPIKPDNPLLTAKNCFITPHVGWQSKEARTRLIKIAANNLQAFLNGKAMNVVS